MYAPLESFHKLESWYVYQIWIGYEKKSLQIKVHLLGFFNSSFPWQKERLFERKQLLSNKTQLWKFRVIFIVKHALKGTSWNQFFIWHKNGVNLLYHLNRRHEAFATYYPFDKIPAERQIPKNLRRVLPALIGLKKSFHKILWNNDSCCYGKMATIFTENLTFFRIQKQSPGCVL